MLWLHIIHDKIKFVFWNNRYLYKTSISCLCKANSNRHRYAKLVQIVLHLLHDGSKKKNSINLTLLNVPHNIKTDKPLQKTNVYFRVFPDANFSGMPFIFLIWLHHSGKCGLYLIKHAINPNLRFRNGWHIDAAAKSVLQYVI